MYKGYNWIDNTAYNVTCKKAFTLQSTVIYF